MRITSDPDDTVAAVHRVKEEIERLTEVQSHALKQATFVGMTPDEAKEYDDRRSQITRLLQHLEALQKLNRRCPGKFSADVCHCSPEYLPSRAPQSS